MTSNLKNTGPILTYHSRGLKSLSAESVTQQQVGRHTGRSKKMFDHFLPIHRKPGERLEREVRLLTLTVTPQ